MSSQELINQKISQNQKIIYQKNKIKSLQKQIISLKNEIKELKNCRNCNDSKRDCGSYLCYDCYEMCFPLTDLS